MIQGTETAKKTIVVPATATSQFLGKRTHLIGIGGCGMRALAKMLMDSGAKVSGSDQAPSAALDRLAKSGAAVRVGQNADNLPKECDLVVYSAAINEQNPELLGARQRGLEVIKYSQMLGRLMKERVGVAVSGTHGKSTTTGMVAFALAASGMDPSFIVGATVDQLGGPSGAGAGKHFVLEACEFDRSFLNYYPTYAAILNVDEDHLDCYADIDAIIEAFRAFASQVRPEGVVIANGDDRHTGSAVGAKEAGGIAAEVQTFGLSEGCTWRGVNLSEDRGRYRLDVEYSGKRFCRLSLKLAGLHNAYNSLAATGLLHHAGVSPEKIAESIGRFEGAQRRMMIKAQLNGITVVDDYAHHPTEIQATLRAIRDYFQPSRLLCVFQPHQHSRTRFLLKDFARCFGAANDVIVPDIYFVRDSVREKDYISAEDLVAQIRLHGGSATYLKTFEDITAHLKNELRPGDLVVTMGAGNIWEVADDIVRWIRADS
ncbi:MAG: UDP-N-acetylmuramate--L-alanine ligase [Phycisphaerae bacterium]